MTNRPPLGMAHDVAEAAAFGAQHAQAPARLGGQVDEVGDGGRGGADRPFLMSLWRWPRICRSSVSCSAEQLAALARSIRRLMKVAVAHHVHLEPERVAARVLGNVLDGANAHGGQRERNAKRLLAARAARISPSACCMPVRPVGAIATGMDTSCPTMVVVVRPSMFTATRWRNLMRWKSAFVGAVGALGVRARVCIVIEHARHAALGDDAQVFDTGDFGQVWHALAPFLKCWRPHGRPWQNARPSKLFARACNKFPFRAVGTVVLGHCARSAWLTISPSTGCERNVMRCAHRSGPQASSSFCTTRLGGVAGPSYWPDLVAPSLLGGIHRASAWRVSSSRFWPCCGFQADAPLSPSDRVTPCSTNGSTHCCMSLRATTPACSAPPMAGSSKRTRPRPGGRRCRTRRTRPAGDVTTAPTAGRPHRGPWRR